MVAAKSVPSPASPPNTVESTTMRDDQHRLFEKGIKTSDSREITGNLEKEYLSKIGWIWNKKLDIIHLYGTDGIGGVAEYAYVGTATATPNDTVRSIQIDNIQVFYLHIHPPLKDILSSESEVLIPFFKSR